MMFSKETALNELKRALKNEDAKFKPLQFEALESIVKNRDKLLLVQKTGWGKSMIYFLATKFLKQNNIGLTIIISPLIALMRNQIFSARNLNLNIETINSTNQNDWEIIKDQILRDRVDILLISPERLANENFINDVLYPIAANINLFVVDEAHCISDWGHDFRPDYKRISNILKLIPPNTPVLCTTATANNRVIEDIKTQIPGLKILRGELKRDSLRLFTLAIPDKSHRFAWLATHLKQMEGSGIIYVLTTRDADILSKWLRDEGIKAYAYYANVSSDKFENSDDYRVALEEALLNNKIKALVATSSLGMGFDKSDLSFVIHFQAPSSIISYYQQVGRAGRGIKEAYGILLSGHEDDDIHEYFRKSAFPTAKNIQDILNLLNRYGQLSIYDMQKNLNISFREIEKTLKFLTTQENPPIVKIKSKYALSFNKYHLDNSQIEQITQIRKTEWNQMQEYLNYDGCLMNFLQKALDDKITDRCGKCGNCSRRINHVFDKNIGLRAADFLKYSYIDFKSRRQVLAGSLRQYNITRIQISNGKALCKYGDSGYGNMVAEDKYGSCIFRDELVDAFVEMIKKWNIEPNLVCCVPSLKRPNLVKVFANKVANKLNITFCDAVMKIKQNKEQKSMENSYMQASNLDEAFKIVKDVSNKNILLIDDVVDSGWTLSVIGALLKKHGCFEVYPAALSSSSKS